MLSQLARSLTSQLFVAAMELATNPGWNILAVDRAAATVEAARQHAKANLDNGQLEVKQADHTHLPAESDSLDVVLAFNVFQQIPDLKAAFQEVAIPKCGFSFGLFRIAASPELTLPVMSSYLPVNLNTAAHSQ